MFLDCLIYAPDYLIYALDCLIWGGPRRRGRRSPSPGRPRAGSLFGMPALCAPAIHRVSSSLLGPVDPSFRALSGCFKLTVRRHKSKKKSLLRGGAPRMVALNHTGPPWRQPRGKSQVNPPQMLPLRGSICMGVDSRNHPFAPGLPPGRFAKANTARRARGQKI